MSTPRVAPAPTPVREIAPIPFDVLSRLLSEYVERLKQKTSILSQILRIQTEQRNEVISDVQYLFSQTSKLVDRASAFHEHFDLDEGERFEIELRLFDAEDALKSARKELRRVGAEPNR